MSSLKKLFKPKAQVVPVYLHSEQVADRIAWQLNHGGRTWHHSEDEGKLVSPTMCCVVAALVPVGPEWDLERRYWQNIDNTKLKRPSFPGLFAQGVFNGPFLDAVQTLNGRPQSWENGNLTEVAWQSFVMLCQYHGFRVKPRAYYLAAATIEQASAFRVP